jgi:hypothetical protein
MTKIGLEDLECGRLVAFETDGRGGYLRRVRNCAEAGKERTVGVREG